MSMVLGKRQYTVASRDTQDNALLIFQEHNVRYGTTRALVRRCKWGIRTIRPRTAARRPPIYTLSEPNTCTERLQDPMSKT
jgi:hypothetical protein